MAILDEIVENKRAEITERLNIKPFEILRQEISAAHPVPCFIKALKADGLNFILEIKPASPSGGVLNQSLDLLSLLEVYNRYACALSVLTDEKYFKGSLNLLGEVVANSSHPVLCKEFVIHAYQIYEARLQGASAILLIVKILDDLQLAELHECAIMLGLTPVVEVQNPQELARALAVNPSVLLINNRNLQTFEIDFNTTQTLAPAIPSEIKIISASGFESAEDIHRIKSFTNSFLIGSALMKTPLADLENKLKALSIDDTD